MPGLITSRAVTPGMSSLPDDPQSYFEKARDSSAKRGAMLGNALSKNFSNEAVKNRELALTFDGLARLKEGWFEGKGAALDQEKLAFVAEKLIHDYPERLPMPAIVPTQDGNLLLEWDAAGDPSLDICLSNLASSYHAFRVDEEDVEQDFNLSNEKAWEGLFAFHRTSRRGPHERRNFVAAPSASQFCSRWEGH